MSYYVYGLRLKGDLECRYIGQTGKTPEARLVDRIRQSRHHVNIGYCAPPDGLSQWVVDNADNIEVFKIAKCETREEARATERVLIALVLRLGHRLLNLDGVPRDQQIGYPHRKWVAPRKERVPA